MAIAPHRDQHGLRRHIVVPDIVVHHLVVPDEFAGWGVERHQAVAEQIHALAVCAVEIIRSRTNRKKNQTALSVDTHH